METKEKINRFLEAEKIDLPKSIINIQEIEDMAMAIKPKKEVAPVPDPIEIQKLKGLTIKLTVNEYKAMYKRKMDISPDLTVQDYVADLIRADLK